MKRVEAIIRPERLGEVAANLEAEGINGFTIADVALGTFARRWFGVEGITRPEQPNMKRWFAQIADRPGFVKYVAPPMS